MLAWIDSVEASLQSRPDASRASIFNAKVGLGRADKHARNLVFLDKVFRALPFFKLFLNRTYEQQYMTCLRYVSNSIVIAGLDSALILEHPLSDVRRSPNKKSH